jgi:hypothetical protein
MNDVEVKYVEGRFIVSELLMLAKKTIKAKILGLRKGKQALLARYTCSKG